MLRHQCLLRASQVAMEFYLTKKLQVPAASAAKCGLLRRMTEAGAAGSDIDLPQSMQQIYSWMQSSHVESMSPEQLVGALEVCIFKPGARLLSWPARVTRRVSARSPLRLASESVNEHCARKSVRRFSGGPLCRGRCRALARRPVQHPLRQVHFLGNATPSLESSRKPPCRRGQEAV